MKKVFLFIPVMKGGGAERVASLLMNEFNRSGCETEFYLTSSRESEIIRCDLNDEIKLAAFESDRAEGARYKLFGVLSSLLCKPFELLKKRVPAFFAKISFVSRYHNQIVQMRKILINNPEAVAIAFLQPTIPMLMFASRGLPNRVIFSERGDPIRLMKHRYGGKFIEKYYTRADAAVFQTEDAKKAYPKNISAKGAVISNPIKADLPEPYHGERNKNITTFCRISAQKNLPLLFETFNKIHKEHPDYILRVIGDSLNEEGKKVEEQLKSYIKENSLEKSVVFEPFKKKIHEAIINDAIYVNSSDYEGISNAMLEAMAIGLPTVCTDCPIGGARATIEDGENGLLVSVGDVEALYKAIKRIIEEDGLAEKLSVNAAKLRDELSLEKTARKWMELF